MKKFGGLLIATLVLAGVWNLTTPVPADAAACANISTYGAVNLNVPILPKKGDYLVWVRMQSPEATGRVLLEINEARCLEVSGTALQPNTWVWQGYTEAGQRKLVSFDFVEGNMIKVIGIQAGIKIDRVLLTDPDCTPEDFGNNCAREFEATAAPANNILALPPPSDQPVSGKIKLSNTPFTRLQQLESLRYIAGGRTLQSATTAEPFDTTLLENGKYTVIIETTLDTGEVIHESTVIEIKNPENVLSPVMRWLRQQHKSLIVIALTIGSVLASVFIFMFIRHSYLKRRQRHFHGF